MFAFKFIYPLLFLNYFFNKKNHLYFHEDVNINIFFIIDIKMVHFFLLKI